MSVKHQVSNWTNAVIELIRPFVTNFWEILIKLRNAFENVHKLSLVMFTGLLVLKEFPNCLGTILLTLIKLNPHMND